MASLLDVLGLKSETMSKTYNETVDSIKNSISQKLSTSNTVSNIVEIKNVQDLTFENMDCQKITVLQANDSRVQMKTTVNSQIDSTFNNDVRDDVMNKLQQEAQSSTGLAFMSDTSSEAYNTTKNFIEKNITLEKLSSILTQNKAQIENLQKVQLNKVRCENATFTQQNHADIISEVIGSYIDKTLGTNTLSTKLENDTIQKAKADSDALKSIAAMADSFFNAFKSIAIVIAMVVGVVLLVVVGGAIKLPGAIFKGFASKKGLIITAVFLVIIAVCVLIGLAVQDKKNKEKAAEEADTPNDTSDSSSFTVSATESDPLEKNNLQEFTSHSKFLTNCPFESEYTVTGLY
jgi:hypothetical protein